MALLGRKSRKARRRVQCEAWLAPEADFALRPCTVVDLHDEGAQLKVDSAERLPNRFTLTFTRASRAGRRCEVRWRRGRAVGVKFVA